MLLDDYVTKTRCLIWRTNISRIAKNGKVRLPSCSDVPALSRSFGKICYIHMMLCFMNREVVF